MASIPLDQLNGFAKPEFIAALADIVEHSPWVADAAADARPFASLSALHQAMTAALAAAEPGRQLDVIRAHPDLAGKAARVGAMTADSVAEQASAGLDRLTEKEFAQFHRLNDAYRARFGFPFIVCVRRHTKDSILRQFDRRLRHDADAERAAALGEIARIVALRLDQRVIAADRLKVHGRLSTHVLDNHAGRPAAGIAVELVELSAAGHASTVARAATNSDGRTDSPLIAERPVPIGTYELRFSVAEYYGRAGAPMADPPFLDVVPVRFAIAEPEGHYHVPLLVTPWSYATYRGS